MVSQTLTPVVGPRGSDIETVVDDVGRLRVTMVNVYFIGEPGSRDWILVDAGMPGSAASILRAAEARYGDVPPRAILLTHGHFDHVGALHTLLQKWPEVMVYAHENELPYVQGISPYPPPDPTVGGGMMARLSPLYPKGPYDFGQRVMALPSDGTIPLAPGWRVIPTPGHSPGHVSFFRESDGTLIVGDAFVTTKQESLFAVLQQRQEMHGPPMYFTCDWDASRESVRTLWALRPRVAATGHGVPMRGVQLHQALEQLAAHFDEMARPVGGRYSKFPAITGREGVIDVPPPVPDPVPKILLCAAGVLVAIGIAKEVRDYQARQAMEARRRQRFHWW